MYRNYQILVFAETLVFAYIVKANVLKEECPVHIEEEIQRCIENSGMYDLSHQVGQVYLGETVGTTFCAVGLRSAIDCIENVSNNCQSNTQQMNLLKLLVDVNKLQSDFYYFCDHLYILEANRSCIKGLYNIPVCLKKMTYTSHDNVVGNVENLTIKHLLDNLCGLYDIIIDCYSVSLPESCSMTSTLFMKLFSGARYPYCDLNEEEKISKLLLSMNNNASYTSLDNMTNFIMCIVLLVCII